MLYVLLDVHITEKGQGSGHVYNSVGHMSLMLTIIMLKLNGSNRIHWLDHFEGSEASLNCIILGNGRSSRKDVSSRHPPSHWSVREEDTRNCWELDVFVPGWQRMDLRRVQQVDTVLSRQVGEIGFVKDQVSCGLRACPCGLPHILDARAQKRPLPFAKSTGSLA